MSLTTSSEGESEPYDDIYMLVQDLACISLQMCRSAEWKFHVATVFTAMDCRSKLL